MAQTLNLKVRKESTSQASSETPMEHISTPLERDFFLASISVIPAAIVWIGFDHLYLGIMLGIALFIFAEYSYPAYKEGRIDLTHVTQFIATMRSVVRTRLALLFSNSQGRRA